MKIKRKILILPLVMILFGLIGCGKDQEPHLSGMERFFYKEYYHQEKSHREEEIVLEKGCKEVVVQGTTISGTIHVVFENIDREGIKYEYIVDGSLKETIQIDKKHTKDKWILSTDINEETEGSLSLSFH
ncbi:MAG: hypothetical protein IJX86_12530 [Lachnospiraceae bacterium]|nr:hypothetical protein [Lachnospiraceae bacterium]